MDYDDERFRPPCKEILVPLNPDFEGARLLDRLGVKPWEIEDKLLEENARPGPYSEDLVQSITKAKDTIASYLPPSRHKPIDPFVQRAMIVQYAEWFAENTGRISKLIQKEKMPKPKGFWASLFG